MSRRSSRVLFGGGFFFFFFCLLIFFCWLVLLITLVLGRSDVFFFFFFLFTYYFLDYLQLQLQQILPRMLNISPTPPPPFFFLPFFSFCFFQLTYFSGGSLVDWGEGYRTRTKKNPGGVSSSGGIEYSCFELPFETGIFILFLVARVIFREVMIIKGRN